jgi:DNA topoisomerase-2
MEPLTPFIFREEDDVLLEHVIDDGDVVEPKFYVPIIPMILVNGATGIGSGWSCSTPNFNPIDVIECIKIWLENDGEIIVTDPDDGSEMSLLPQLIPFYRGFKGKIEASTDNKFVTYGVMTKEKNKVHISELPIGMWTDKFKEFCEDLLIEKKIKSFQNYSTPKDVKFIITESEDGYNCNLTNLKMFSYLHTSNMVLFNEKEQLKKYSIEEIINEFCLVRYEFYKKRKRYILNSIQKELKYLGNKARFISEIIEKKLHIMNVPEEKILVELQKRGYDKTVDDDGDEGSYNYLLKMQIKTFTFEKVTQIKNDIIGLETKLQNVTKVSEKQMWLNDLDEFVTEYNKWLIIMGKTTTTGKKK